MLPGARGRGHGLSLHLRGNLTMVRRGAERLVGSCSADHEPMARVFSRLGYERKWVQHYFGWDSSGTGDGPSRLERTTR